VVEAVARRVLLVAALIFATACDTNTTGRSQAELGATAFGAMTPPGSKMFSERYAPSLWTVEGVQCATLTRYFVSTDADGFLSAFRGLATQRSALGASKIPAKPFFNFPSGGYTPAASIEVDGTYVTLDFHDGRDARDTYPWPESATREDWRYLIVMRVRDGSVERGGGCR
jgi:hypothetical protein